MGSISISLPTDGTTADVSDYNIPLTTITTVINGNLDDANIKTSAAIDFAKISGGNSASLIAWTSWTPTVTGFTTGNGTIVAKYCQIGKTVKFRLIVTMGSTSAITGGISFTLPVASVNYGGSGTNSIIIGNANFEDTGVGSAQGLVTMGSTASASSATISINNVANTYGSQTAVGATIPFTWGTGDGISAQGFYEAL